MFSEAGNARINRQMSMKRERGASEEDRKSLGSSDQAHTHMTFAKAAGSPWRVTVSKDAEEGQALQPTETVVCPLCSGLHVIVVGKQALFWLENANGQLNGLCAQQTNPSTTQLTTRPAAPKDRSKSGCRSKRGKKREEQQEGAEPEQVGRLQEAKEQR